jgi:hypothetical protein
MPLVRILDSLVMGDTPEEACVYAHLRLLCNVRCDDGDSRSARLYSGTSPLCLSHVVGRGGVIGRKCARLGLASCIWT